MSPSKGERSSPEKEKKPFLRAFLTKLRKRKIIETLAAFIGGGWLIYEIVHWVLVAHYHLPEKTLDVTIVTLIGMLLCALIWRWFGGIERPRKFRVESVLVPLVVLITILLDINLLLHLKGPEEAAIPAAKWKNSIAVLPFVDMSPQKDQDWFCDGITDEIIGRLGNISELKVPARTSVFFFKGKDQDIREIGQKLGVATVLEGSIQKVETKLRARVQLINIANGFHVWAEEYDRELKDVFAIQDEIALAVVDKLKITLLGDEKAKLAKHHAIDPIAYEAYLKGLYYWWRWSQEDYTNVLRNFQKAIEIEPDYAPAHAGLALAYVDASTWNNIGLWSPREGVPKGKEAAQKAIQLDPMLPDGYVAMGFARMNFDWDWAGAEKDFKRALELSPHSPLALDAYASFLLLARGRLDEAIAVVNKAIELDPLSPALHSDLGVDYYMFGQFDRAIPCFRKTLELDSNFFWARLNIGWCYLFTSRSAEALVVFQNMVQVAPDSPYAQQALGYAYGATGRRDEALEVLANLDQLAKTRYIPPSAQAYVYLGLGQKDIALDWLEKAYAERDTEMIFLMVDPPLAPLRNEPRFQALLKKVGLDK
jgi:adenylate cyclase